MKKKYEDLLQALHSLKMEGFDFRCDVLGTGPQKEVLLDLCRDLGLEESVTFLGHVEDVLPHFEASDFFIHPSTDEGLPNALQEAMSLGVIPIARNVGGIHEIWPPELNHFLIPNTPGTKDLTHSLRTALVSSEHTLLSWKK